MTHPADTRHDPTAARDEFRVAGAAPVMLLLRSLMERGVAIQLSAASGIAYATELTQVDEERRQIAFDLRADEPQVLVQRLVASEGLTAVCYLDQVRVQFDVGARLLVHGAAGPRLQAAMPAELLRFQRRNAFRVNTFDHTGPHVALRHPALPDMQMTLRVLDVSASGLALLQRADQPAIEPGSLLQGVQVVLDEDAAFQAVLEVRHITRVGGDARGARLGCTLSGLAPDDERRLQRYVNNTQRRWRMLAAKD